MWCGLYCKKKELAREVCLIINDFRQNLPDRANPLSHLYHTIFIISSLPCDKIMSDLGFWIKIITPPFFLFFANANYNIIIAYCQGCVRE